MNNAVTLSLISHTNVGKTTLARTLLRQDVGEALDQPHVTDINTAYTMLERDGDILRLWDTPGFGDTARLLRRLKKSASPLGWFMTQGWDRFADRPLWCSQQAMANVRDEADIVLYLINAAESPEDAGYVDMEMEILEWVGKPVIVLLNQTGTPGNPLEEEREEKRWSKHLKRFPGVREVLALDAFARCWVQEGELLDVIAAQILPDKSDTFSLLSRLWKEHNLLAFYHSMKTLSEQLAGSLLDREEATKETILQRVGIGRDGLRVELNKARKALAERLADRTKVATNRMIELHELEGRTASRIAHFTSSNYGEPSEVSEPLWSAIGGVAAGAAGGLVADLLHGGLTFGGGTVLGAILGGPGAYLLARGYNLTRSGDKFVRWSQEHFISQSGIALLSYLAIAHFGRGRGKWEESAHPELWEHTVHSVVEDSRDLLESIWKSSNSSDVEESKIEEQLEEVLVPAGAETLRRLYPEVSIEVPDGKSLLAHLKSLTPEARRSSSKPTDRPTGNRHQDSGPKGTSRNS